jgi:hypothetical protein
MEDITGKPTKGRYKWQEPEQLAVKAQGIIDAINNDIQKFPNWLFEPFLTGRLHITEGAVYVGAAVCRNDDWIVQGLDGNLIICSSENFERIRKMLKEKAENEREERN